MVYNVIYPEKLMDILGKGTEIVLKNIVIEQSARSTEEVSVGA